MPQILSLIICGYVSAAAADLSAKYIRVPVSADTESAVPVFRGLPRPKKIGKLNK
jgi:hypothetical protein